MVYNIGHIPNQMVEDMPGRKNNPTDIGKKVVSLMPASQPEPSAKAPLKDYLVWLLHQGPDEEEKQEMQRAMLACIREEVKKPAKPIKMKGNKIKRPTSECV